MTTTTTTTNKVLQQISAARAVSVPIIAVQTPDQFGTMRAIAAMMGDRVESEAGGRKQSCPVPKVAWDRVRGLYGLNDAGRAALVSLVPGGGSAAEREAALKSATEYLENALDLAERLPEYAAVFALNAHRWIEDGPVTTGVLRLRDRFKADMRTLVLLGPAFRMPSELQHDVIVLEQALPTSAELEDVVTSTYKSARQAFPELPVLTPEVVARGKDAVRGLATFDAEQVVAMSIKTSGELGLDLEGAWERKRSTINQPWLKISKSLVSWDELGGHDRLRNFSEMLAAGRDKPVCVFMLDEVEKMMAGTQRGGYGDATGVSDDQKGVLLRHMEDLGWTGMLCVGPPGTGKTVVGQALAKTLGAEFVQGDFGAAKGGIVGQSEAQIRDMFRVVEGLGGEKVLVYATANALEAVTPDMRRRFWMGRWYFDLPDAKEKAAIWTIHLAKLGFNIDEEFRRLPEDTDWTGAEIRNCCAIAYRLRIGLDEAAKYIVPVAREMPDQVQHLRELANGRFLSTSYAGTFDKGKVVEVEGSRRFGPRLIGVTAMFVDDQQVAEPQGVEQVVGKKKAN